MKTYKISDENDVLLSVLLFLKKTDLASPRLPSSCLTPFHVFTDGDVGSDFSSEMSLYAVAKMLIFSQPYYCKILLNS